jgi:predicted kinase
LNECPEKVDSLTRKEAGYISETLTLATLQAGRNAIYHCNLKSIQWYQDSWLSMLRRHFPALKVAVFHITADLNVVLERSRRRARETGREICETEIANSLVKLVPEAVEQLKKDVDFCCTIRNNEDELELLDVDLEVFGTMFEQEALAEASRFITPPPQEDGSQTSQQQNRRLRRSVLCESATPHSSSSRRKTSYARLYRRSTIGMKPFSAYTSSEENNKADDLKFYGRFTHIRETLDYSYHKNYTCERQLFQDAIIREFLDAAVIKDQNGEVCTTPTEPWIVFTAGAMGSGKGYTLKKLVKEGRFPLMAFVRVDPDEIRRYLPDYHLYIRECPEQAGELTNKEAGYIAEILTLAALQSGKNVIVDGSLRRSEWYKKYFNRLRKEFRNLRIAIIHVSAPREAVFQRAAVGADALFNTSSSLVSANLFSHS